MEPRLLSQKGSLLLADISGYTAFFTQGELEHAQDILRCLLQTLLEHLAPPLVVCELEGDAVFSYAPEGSFSQGQTLLESIENLYRAFATAREQMHRNTSCTCTACSLIPQLDLKFVAHHGAFVVQQVDRRHPPKPSGPEVIRLHRLLKNSVREATGIQAYAFFTAECAEALRLGQLLEGTHSHTEEYEFLGPVSGYVYDLHPVWQQHCEQRRILVAPEEAWLSVSGDYPLPPALLWEYLNDPEHKRRWRQADSMTVTGSQQGRTGRGTVHHCAHGKMVIPETIIDWRPFEYVTCECVWPLGVTARCTTYLVPQANGTRLVTHVERPKGRNPPHDLVARIAYALMRQKLLADYTRSLSNLRELVEASGRVGETMPQPELTAGGT